MKTNDYLNVIISMLLILPTMLIFAECDSILPLPQLIALSYGYMLYKLSFTSKGKKLYKSVLKMNIYLF